MRLVSLEIKGFKSFAEKTIINFNENITGVVGPNGCGKSNVVDAIRWVLGEQKTSALRSEKMENVIFNGTKNRKASSLAEVYLTFENNKNLLPTEYHTVTISRHYYRNGESEYRLNNVNCRLKDITGLFMDTGISSDSYAIIELGMVDEILTDKEHSRRRLFEQAAGISKYKARKKETLNKLEATQGDLNRVDDLLFEIENNLKSLESQAKKTERFYKLKEEYKSFSVDLAKLNLAGYKQQFDDLKKQQEEEEQKRLASETEIVMKEAALQKEKADNLEKEKALLASQKQLNELVSQIKQKENEKNILTENLKFQKDKQTNLSAQNKSMQENIQRIEQEINLLSESRIKENQLVQTEQQSTEQLKQLMETARTNHQQNKNGLDEHNIQLRELEQQLAANERELTVSRVQKENLLKEIENGKIENSNRQNELNRFQEQLILLQQQEADQKNKIQLLTDEGDQLQLKITGAEEALDALREQLNQLNRKLDARQNEFNLTKSFIENMEGFPDSIKFLKQNSDWSADAPLLSDIIAGKPEYRAAIESYLEPYLNYYVVANMNEAMRAVNLLSSASKGRANFFVLNDFTSSANNVSENISNAVAALSVVQFADKYSNLISHLLAHVYILNDDLEPAVTDDKKNILISRTGKFIRQPRSLSGGQVGSFAGKRLGRVQNLEQLSTEMEQLKSESDKLMAQQQLQIAELQQLKNSSHDEELDLMREEHNRIKTEMTQVKTKMENLQQLIVKTETRFDQISISLHQLDEQNSVQRAAHAQQQQQFDHWTSVQKQLRDAFNESDKSLSEASNQFNQQNIRYLQQQNKLNAMLQELSFKQQQFETLSNQFTENEKSIQHCSETIVDIENKLNISGAGLQHDYEQKQLQEKAVAQTEQTYYDSRGIINEHEESVKQMQRNKEQIEHLLTSIKEKNNDLRLQLNSLKERLDIEFKVSLDSLLAEEVNEKLNREELDEKVNRIKNRIETFGEINPMAMEAFQEMKQRHDFITNQKADLVSAKESLLQTIDEIETTAKEQFLTAFNTIKENFQRVFRGLFTPEDDCDLILTDPNDLLETKVEIIAKPKGKRPQTINQLSGGEKTLTAISLLFALYLHKPAPFCILDEVDAPLDDANVGKFTNIIRDFSENSQFVLVTHNKNTMSSVDVIYGVTMQEEGISKVVPVSFSNLN